MGNHEDPNLKVLPNLSHQPPMDVRNEKTRLENGLSIRRTQGFTAKSRPMAIRCSSPPSSNVFTRGLTLAAVLIIGIPRNSNSKHRFFKTVIFGITEGFWDKHTIFRYSGSRLLISLPSIRTWPASASLSLAMIFRIVDYSASVGPRLLVDKGEKDHITAVLPKSTYSRAGTGKSSLTMDISVI